MKRKFIIGRNLLTNGLGLRIGLLEKGKTAFLITKNCSLSLAGDIFFN
jgi:hypothetical protein